MWLSEQESSVLRHWLQRTKVPAMVTLGDGQIAWCNSAFEELLGYTYMELVGPDGMSWAQLSSSPRDLAAESRMRESLLVSAEVHGSREDYTAVTRYLSKQGNSVDVFVHVLRYPAYGAYQFFLVTATPIHKGLDFARNEIAEINANMVRLVRAGPAGESDHGSLSDRLWQWSVANPRLSVPLGLMILSLFLGERVIELFERVVRVFRAAM